MNEITHSEILSPLNIHSQPSQIKSAKKEDYSPRTEFPVKLFRNSGKSTKIPRINTQSKISSTLINISNQPTPPQSQHKAPKLKIPTNNNSYSPVVLQNTFSTRTLNDNFYGKKMVKTTTYRNLVIDDGSNQSGILLSPHTLEVIPSPRENENKIVKALNPFEVGGTIHVLFTRANYRDLLSIIGKLVVLLIVSNVGPSRRILSSFSEIPKCYPEVIFATIHVNQQTKIDIPELESVFTPRCPIFRFFVDGNKIKETSGPYMTRLREAINIAIEIMTTGSIPIPKLTTPTKKVSNRKKLSKLKRGNTHEPGKKPKLATSGKHRNLASDISPETVRKARSKSEESIRRRKLS